MYFHFGREECSCDAIPLFNLPKYLRTNPAYYSSETSKNVLWNPPGSTTVQYCRFEPGRRVQILVGSKFSGHMAWDS
ncbi:hypothetical protein TMatcc_008200 [Talaromyces marneffei ATCC 18224]